MTLSNDEFLGCNEIDACDELYNHNVIQFRYEYLDRVFIIDEQNNNETFEYISEDIVEVNEDKIIFMLFY